MRKVTSLCKPKEKECIFTEGINYFETQKESIWGLGDKDTLEILKDVKIHGKWLNLAAGDGRYNLNLLEKVDEVTASDIDESALSKLWYNTPKALQSKLKIRAFDMTKKFPFERKSFDGIFCAGTLHLFPVEVFKKIFLEIDRIIKPRGKVIIDFATDIRRTSYSGQFLRFGDEPIYTLTEAKTILNNLFKGYELQIYEFNVPKEDVKEANPPYKFSCKAILLIADKRE